MRRVDRLSAILAVALACPGLAPAGEKPGDGWVPLFNGKDLEGWKFHLGKEGADNEGTFAVRDGMLVCSGRPTGYMYTERSYSNYTLKVDWAFKRPEGLANDADFRGNSGYLIHMGEKNALGVWPRSIEVQGTQRDPGRILPIPRDVKCSHTTDQEARAKALKPLGQWNTMEIDVRGGEMTVSINGNVVTRVSDCELTEGPIGLQSEGAEIHWRNILIRRR